MIRYYGDEHIARAVADGLIARNVDMVLAVDAGMSGASDADHLAYAMAQGRVVVTRDDDFLRLNSEGRPHTGIAFLTRDWRAGALIKELAELRARLTGEEMVGRVEYL